jgi:two-component system sensor histidine kinase QseC
LVVQATHEIDELETEHAPLLHKYARRVAFQIWENGRELRLHSANAPQQPLSKQERGFSDNVIDGTRWRVFSTWDETGEFLIQVAERTEARDVLAGDLAGNLLKPLGFSLPLLAILLWIAVMRGLRPLEQLTREVKLRKPDNLTALQASSAPLEVLPLIEQLNRLFERIEVSMEKERRFTADAAHELRTPVAAIRAQAQVAQGATDNAERKRALDNAILGCDRASHLIDQMLTLARVDTLDNQLGEQCRLNDLAVEVIAALAPEVHGKRVQLELLDGDEATVRGNTGLLRVLLRNLLDNAIKHTAQGTTVQVNIARSPETACLSVSDNGPGIPEAEREKVVERFYRPLGTQASGSGLGLSIVKRIAELHDASLQMEQADNRQGLRVTVCFRL